MSDKNPYEPPQVQLDDPAQFGDAAAQWQLVAPKSVSAGQGWTWIADGFRLFAKNPGIWIVNFILFFLILAAISMVPFLSIAANFLSAIFTGGFMRGARVLDEGGELEVNHLFAGFKENAGKLVGVGGLYLVGTIAIMILIFVLFFAIVGIDFFTNLANMGGNMPPEEVFAALGLPFILAMLIGMALITPLLMAYWFAPALVILHDVDVIESMKMSFMGCLRNIWPFLIYGIIGLLFSIVALIPLGLGFIVLGPVFLASMYVAYKDIFIASEPTRTP